MEDMKICFSLILVLFALSSAKFSSSYDWNNLLLEFDLETGRYEKPSCEMTELPPDPKSMCCGIDVTSNNRVIGGTPTALNQYPWLALIEYKSLKSGKMSFRCAGSLISGRYVITAAHCVSEEVMQESMPMNVVLGDYDKFHDGPDCITVNGETMCTKGELRVSIEKYFVHPKRAAGSRQHDIALIKLSKMSPYTEAIRPICLPSTDLSRNLQQKLWLYVAGWGTMKMVKSNATKYQTFTSSVKRHVQVPLYSTKKCQTIWPYITSKQMCAGGIPGKDVCMGDSGGPLMFNNRGQFEVSGIVSYGYSAPCAAGLYPSVYANVYQYLEWIRSVIINEHEKKFNYSNVQ